MDLRGHLASVVVIMMVFYVTTHHHLMAQEVEGSMVTSSNAGRERREGVENGAKSQPFIRGEFGTI